MSLPRYPQYKPSGVEWLGAVPSHWSVAQFKASVSETKNGVWGDDPLGTTDDIPCVRVADFDRVKLSISSSNLTLRCVAKSERNGRLLKRGDLLIEKSGGGEATPVGCVVLYDETREAVCSNFIARVQLRDGMISSYWRYAHAAAYSARINTRSIKQTSGIQNLDQDAYLAEMAPFPPTIEQRTISVFLDNETMKIDGLVAEQEKLIGLLAEKRQSAISHAVTKGLNTDALMKDSGFEWLGEVPSHWSLVQLQRLIQRSRRITYGIVQPGGFDETGRFMVRGQDYSNGWATPSSIFRVADSVEQPYKRSRLVENDLLMTIVGAGVGNMAVVPEWLEGANVTQTTARIAVDSTKADVRFVAAFFAGSVGRRNIDLYAKGAAQPGLNLEHVKIFVLTLPPLHEQRAIAAYLDVETAKLDALTAECERAIELLRERRAALISAAVTGQIDVRGVATEGA